MSRARVSASVRDIARAIRSFVDLLCINHDLVGEQEWHFGSGSSLLLVLAALLRGFFARSSLSLSTKTDIPNSTRIAKADLTSSLKTGIFVKGAESRHLELFWPRTKLPLN